MLIEDKITGFTGMRFRLRNTTGSYKQYQLLKVSSALFGLMDFTRLHFEVTRTTKPSIIEDIGYDVSGKNWANFSVHLGNEMTELYILIQVDPANGDKYPLLTEYRLHPPSTDPVHLDGPR